MGETARWNAKWKLDQFGKPTAAALRRSGEQRAPIPPDARERSKQRQLLLQRPMPNRPRLKSPKTEHHRRAKKRDPHKRSEKRRRVQCVPQATAHNGRPESGFFNYPPALGVADERPLRQQGQRRGQAERQRPTCPVYALTTHTD